MQELRKNGNIVSLPKGKIRETTLVQVMKKLDKTTMLKAIKKYKGRFSPKYRAFSILHNDVEDFFRNPTRYGNSYMD